MLSVIVALQCVATRGDRIVIVSPIWPNIFQAAEVVGAMPTLVPLAANWSSTKPCWQLDLDQLFDACDDSTKAIFISSPGNPTGWTMAREEQLAVLDFARQRGIAIISDEVYGPLVFDGTKHAPSFLQIANADDDVFVINSFSKPWAMTGWRVGWLVHSRALDEPMNVISVVDNSGATAFAQYGALAALSHEGEAFLASMRKRCADGRTVVQEFLGGQNRIRWIPPDGAFYGFLRLENLKNSLEFARGLVRRWRVGVAPGSAFGAEGDPRNEACIRICFALDPTMLREWLDRIGKALTHV